MGDGMTRNRKFLAFLVAAFVLVLLGVTRFTQAQESKPANATPKAAAASPAVVARGKYIVEDVAYCTNCHTPRNSHGVLDRSKWLQGGPLFWQPAHPLADYPQLVPRIGGTPPATDDEMITLLTTGIWKDGNRLRAPMPAFRLTREDAQAVVAYLKTLTPVE